jgi:hypothetical protein
LDTGSLWLSQLSEDMCEWVKCNPVPWTDVELEPSIIGRDARSIYDLVVNIYKQKARTDKASIWCCKSTFNVYYLPEIERHIQPFYVYLFRDGRDVAVSFKKAFVGPKHVYFIAKQWAEEQALAMDFLQHIPDERKLYIAYESVLADPQIEIERICKKLQIDFDSNMLEYYKSDESIHTAESGEMWTHVKEPILKNNKQKYLRELTAEEIQIFEMVAGDVLQKLGYELSSNRSVSLSFNLEEYHKQNNMLATEVRKRASKSELARRLPQEQLLYRIKEKFGLLTEGVITNG